MSEPCWPDEPIGLDRSLTEVFECLATSNAICHQIPLIIRRFCYLSFTDEELEHRKTKYLVHSHGTSLLWNRELNSVVEQGSQVLRWMHNHWRVLPLLSSVPWMQFNWLQWPFSLCELYFSKMKRKNDLISYEPYSFPSCHLFLCNPLLRPSLINHIGKKKVLTREYIWPYSPFPEESAN